MTTQTIAESPARAARPAVPARQRIEFRSGNEAAALAARDIGYHVMGFFPITPSTEVAENLSKMQAEGQHDIAMIAGDGEHGAAGICYGAALGGGRVLNATSSQGLLYALEQLPVQAGTRVPMVLNVAARAVSGPLDIRGDHSDFYYALNTGWIVLLRARPASGVRPQLRGDPHRRAPRRAAAGDGGVRRLLHQPPEAAHPGVRRRGRHARASSASARNGRRRWTPSTRRRSART